jgi:hypothetical protein
MVECAMFCSMSGCDRVVADYQSRVMIAGRQ